MITAVSAINGPTSPTIMILLRRERHVRSYSKSGHVQCNSVCPLCANSGHWTVLFDDFVRATDQRGWHSEAKSFGSREVYNQFDLRGLLDCKRRGLFSL